MNVVYHQSSLRCSLESFQYLPLTRLDLDSTHSQADELYKICSIMGTPTQQSWPEGLKLAAAMNFRFPTFASTPLSKLMTHASPEAIDLITGKG
jgi:hypothetical protein